MIFIKALFIVILVLCSLMLIGLVLLQKSKSEGLGLAFGAGAGESLFGARAGNVLSRATVVIGCVFMAAALVLGMLFAQKDQTLMDGVQTELVQPTAVQPSPIDGLDLGTPEIQPGSTQSSPIQLDVGTPGSQSVSVQPSSVQGADSKATSAPSPDLPFGNQRKGIDADLAAAEAGVAEAQAEKAVLDAQVAEAEAVIAVAEGDADAAEAVAEAAQADDAATASVVEAIKADAKADIAAKQEAEAAK